MVNAPAIQALACTQAGLLAAIASPNTKDAINLIAAQTIYTSTSGHFNSQYTNVRGLQAYRANANTLAARALQTPYPVMGQLLGHEPFEMLARDLWQSHPPASGDLAQWGGALADWMHQNPVFAALLADYPYLCDVARCEWALHLCTTARDGELEAESFVILSTQEPAQVRLRVSAGAQVLCSAYPLASLMLAHGAGGSDGTAAQQQMQSLPRLLQQGVAQSVLVWRQGYAPRVRALADNETTFAQAVVQGQSLQTAMDAAAPDFDFSAWLTTHVHNGLVWGADSMHLC